MLIMYVENYPLTAFNSLAKVASRGAIGAISRKPFSLQILRRQRRT
jgi:hypothetical protein